MNLGRDWLELLRRAGHDVVHWSDVGAQDASDADIMQHALIERRAVFTSDLDFGAMLAASQAAGPSVIQLRSKDTLAARLGAAVTNALVRTRTDIESGALVTIEADRFRVRPLPFKFVS